jgi:hypothetical protein
VFAVLVVVWLLVQFLLPPLERQLKRLVVLQTPMSGVGFSKNSRIVDMAVVLLLTKTRMVVAAVASTLLMAALLLQAVNNTTITATNRLPLNVRV